MTISFLSNRELKILRYTSNRFLPALKGKRAPTPSLVLTLALFLTPSAKLEPPRPHSLAASRLKAAPVPPPPRHIWALTLRVSWRSSTRPTTTPMAQCTAALASDASSGACVTSEKAEAAVRDDGPNRCATRWIAFNPTVTV
jgi:hypothetical protein